MPKFRYTMRRGHPHTLMPSRPGLPARPPGALRNAPSYGYDLLGGFDERGRSMARLLTWTLVAVLAFVGTARAQSEWQVDVLIPDVISIRTATQQVAFGITLDNYPPESFPAIYPATDPADGVLRTEVFSSAAGSWSLLLEIPDLLDDLGRAMVPADRVMFRVNGGAWMRGSPVAQVIHASSGPTDGWEALDIEFQLELDGTERPGSFSVSTLLTALSDGS